MSARSLSCWAAVLLALLLFCPLVFAQPGRPGQPGRIPGPQPPVRPGQPPRPGQPGDADAAAGAAGCAACGSMMAVMAVAGVISIVSTIIWIFVVLWVARDAKSRGMDNTAMYIVMVLFLGVIGLIIYVVSRPQGDLKDCRECGKKRLRGLKRCPHCRAA